MALGIFIVASAQRGEDGVARGGFLHAGDAFGGLEQFWQDRRARTGSRALFQRQREGGRPILSSDEFGIRGGFHNHVAVMVVEADGAVHTGSKHKTA